MQHATLQRYLAGYAEPEASLLGDLPQTHWNRCVVIPAYDETPAFLDRFIARFATYCDDTLVIVVVNRPSGSAECRANNALITHLQRHCGKRLWQKQHLTLYQFSNISWLLVDRSSQLTIDAQQGVGLARKIGADIACALRHLKRLRSDWIYSTDADAHLPNNYFATDTPLPGVSAQVFEFTHGADESDTGNDCHRATQFYETHLRYFRDGLAFAGSPYAFYTLGSTLAISAEHYSAVRGFPKRAGGEDFYLLNKLAKVGNIKSVASIQLQIEPRLSHRVPFGTGPAVARIMAQLQNVQPYSSYNPTIFVRLKTWLQSIDRFWAMSRERSHTLELHDKALTQVAYAIDFPKFLDHAKYHCVDRMQFEKQFQQWFDGFRTLKFIHFLQASGYPPVPLQTAVQRLNEMAHV